MTGGGKKSTHNKVNKENLFLLHLGRNIMFLGKSFLL